MKSLKIFLVLAVAALAVACTEKSGYEIKGTMGQLSELEDGDSIYLAQLNMLTRSLVRIDSTVVTKGQFSFKGTHEKPEVYYILYSNQDKNPLYAEFFLENGKINAYLGEDSISVTGTANNDIYQQFRSNMQTVEKEEARLSEAMTDTTLTDEQRTELGGQIDALDNQIKVATTEILKKNIATPAGIAILEQTYYYLDVNDLDPLMSQIPAEYDNDQTISQIKENVTRLKATDKGQHFADVTLKSPEGKDVSLSDYAGKGNIVLVDFWASWCGPCCREMPNIVEAYAKYKSKGLEIVGISLDGDQNAWTEAIKRLGITWPQMSDLQGWKNEAASIYAVSAIPHTVLIDRDGTIIERGLTGEALLSKLEELFK